MADLNSTIVRGKLRVTADEYISGNLNVTGTLTGNGSGLTSLNGSNISSGTVAFARLPTGTGANQVAIGNHTHSNYAIDSNVVHKTGDENIDGTKTFKSNVYIRDNNNHGTITLGDGTTTLSDSSLLIGGSGGANLSSSGLSFEGSSSITINRGVFGGSNGGVGIKINKDNITKRISTIGSNNGFITNDYIFTFQNKSGTIALEPISKTYTGLIGTVNEFKNATFYFLNVKPTSWNKEWRIRYRIEASLDSDLTPSNYALYTSIHDCEMIGARGIVNAYAYFNGINNTSYRTIFYNITHCTTEAGFNANYPHKIGIELTSSANPTSTSYKRTIKVTLFDYDGCEVTFNDTPEIPAQATRTDYTKINSTYYPNQADSNAPGYAYRGNLYSNGLQETGDDNTTDRLYYHNQYMDFGSTMGLSGYNMYGLDSENKVQPISLYQSGYTSYTTNISTTRVYNTAGFDWTRGLFRYLSSGFIAAGTTNTIIHSDKVNQFDYRYTDNCVSSSSATTLSFVRNKYVYLRGTIGSDNLFYLAPIEVTYNSSTYKRAWTQDIPTTEDGYVYWLVGHPYSTDSYQLRLYAENQLYWFKDGKFREYVAIDSNLVHKGSSSSPSNEDIYGTKTFKSGGIGFYSTPSGSSTGYTGTLTGDYHSLTFTRGNSGPASFSLVSSTHGTTTFTPNSNNGFLTLSHTGGLGGTAYLDFPSVGTSSVHKIIATIDDIPANIQDGATTGSLEQKFDGSTFNFVNPNSPLGGTTVNIGIATGTYATMLGGKGRVEGKRSFVNGTQVVATGNYAHAEGNNTHAAGHNSHAEGIQTYASGSAAHAEGSSTAATETGAHSEGYGTHADGVYTHAEGAINFVLGDNAHAEGGRNIIGVYSGPSPEPGPAPEPGTAVHAEGMGSHAEGNNNTITGYYSHAEGQGNTISSHRAHAEGNGNTVSGAYAHAEGNNGVASGEGAHSEGLYGHAIGNYSHAEGAATYANGLYSHVAGQDSTANGTASFASGYHVTANRDYQTVLGKYNLGQADTLLEVGKGTAENARSNAFEVYTDGLASSPSYATKDLIIQPTYFTNFKWNINYTAAGVESESDIKPVYMLNFTNIPSNENMTTCTPIQLSRNFLYFNQHVGDNDYLGYDSYKTASAGKNNAGIRMLGANTSLVTNFSVWHRVLNNNFTTNNVRREVGLRFGGYDIGKCLLINDGNLPAKSKISNFTLPDDSGELLTDDGLNIGKYYNTTTYQDLGYNYDADSSVSIIKNSGRALNNGTDAYIDNYDSKYYVDGTGLIRAAQQNIAIALNITTNINNHNMNSGSNPYSFTLPDMSTGNPFIIIKRNGNENISTEDARYYLLKMTGSGYLPTFSEDYARYSYMITANDMMLYKIQWVPNDNAYTGQLRLYLMQSLTDEKVKQTNTTTSANYNILLSSSASSTTEYTESARKSSKFYANPSTGALYSTSFYATSDKRLKTNIAKTDLNYLNIINSLKLKEYNFKDQNNTEDKYIGLIAQQLLTVLPDKYKNTFVTAAMDKKHTLSINEGKVQYLTMGAVQELSKISEKQQKQIDKLTEENKELKQIIKEMNKKLDALLSK